MSLFDTGIRPAIDAHLVAEAKKTRDYGSYWSASSAGYCMRKQIFQRLGVPPSKPDDPRKQRVFTAGKVFHDWIQELTREAGISVAQEVELQDEDLMVRGHFDDLVLMPGDTSADEGYNKAKPRPDHLILYDYKTVNSRSFTYSKGGEMSYYHKMQLGTYMYMLRESGKAGRLFGNNPLYSSKDLTEARILKISKDDLRMEEQQLMWNIDLEVEVRTYWMDLRKYWLDKKIPPCTCADHENGFLAREAYNDYFYKGEPCSLLWYTEWKAKNKEVV